MTERAQRPASQSRYDLLVPLARGGMASVYVGRLRGVDGFSRLVAIKRAHEHIASDPKMKSLVADEARVASRLHHPNVVAVHDVEQLDGELLLVMPYVEGASLAELLELVAANGAELSPGVALSIILDVCAGLHAAHELTDDDGVRTPIIHRDVSPQNIMVGVDGVARLTDFGVARTVMGEGALSNTDTLKGKAGYMAPEYVGGHSIDTRSDLFALGVVLWESLTHARLFGGKHQAHTLLRVLHDPVPSLSESREEDFVHDFDVLLERVLSKRPEDRHATATELARDIRDVATTHGIVIDQQEVAAEVRRLVGDQLAARKNELTEAINRKVEVADVPPAPITDLGAGHTELLMTTDAARGGETSKRGLLGPLAAIASLAIGGVIAWTTFQPQEARRAHVPNEESAPSNSSPSPSTPTPSSNAAQPTTAAPSNVAQPTTAAPSNEAPAPPPVARPVAKAPKPPQPAIAPRASAVHSAPKPTRAGDEFSPNPYR